MSELNDSPWPPPAAVEQRTSAAWVRAGVAAIAVATLSVVGVNVIATRAKGLGDSGSSRGGFPGAGAFPGGGNGPTQQPQQRTRTARGTVTSVSGNSFTIGTRNGGTRTITVTSSTEIQVGSGGGSLSDIAVGDTVQVTGTSTGTNAIDATTVVVG